MEAGIVLNPETSLESSNELLTYTDYIMAMTVHPGFSGQPFLEKTVDKLNRLSQLKKVNNFELSVDGAISEQRIKELMKIGVDSFVLGTSGLFNRGESYNTIIQRLKNLDVI